MKNFILGSLTFLMFILSFSLICIASYGRDTVVYVRNVPIDEDKMYSKDGKIDLGHIKDTSALTAREVYEDAKDGFQRLVSNLQGPSKHVYEVYVKQCLVDGITRLLVAVFFLTITIIILREPIKKLEFDDNDSGKHIAMFVVGILLAIATIVLIINFLSGGLGRMINPEYYAIQDIVATFK